MWGEQYYSYIPEEDTGALVMSYAAGPAGNLILWVIKKGGEKLFEVLADG